MVGWWMQNDCDWQNKGPAQENSARAQPPYAASCIAPRVILIGAINVSFPACLVLLLCRAEIDPLGISGTMISQLRINRKQKNSKISRHCFTMRAMKTRSSAPAELSTPCPEPEGVQVVSPAEIFRFVPLSS